MKNIVIPSQVDDAAYPQKYNQEMQLLNGPHVFVSRYPYTAIFLPCHHKICKTQASIGRIILLAVAINLPIFYTTLDFN